MLKIVLNFKILFFFFLLLTSAIFDQKLLNQQKIKILKMARNVKIHDEKNC